MEPFLSQHDCDDVCQRCIHAYADAHVRMNARTGVGMWVQGRCLGGEVISADKGLGSSFLLLFVLVMFPHMLVDK